MKAWPYPRWIAHRGAGKLAPENTLAAFRLGLHYGYRMAECDVKLSADGVPFLLHDATLERTTNGRGPAGDLPWRELSRLDAGNWHSGAYLGEPLPSLESVARWCQEHDFLLNIEIKPSPGLERRTGEVVAAQAAQLWRDAAIPPLLTSFSADALAGALATTPALPRGLLLDELWTGWLQTARRLQCVAVVCQYALWDAATVASVHAAGMRCLSYTVNDEAQAQRLIALGVEGLITDSVNQLGPAAASAPGR
ncbi:MAG TPA: glycerophosphodiester phosphodiesterase [Ramlibacter sp.]|nr:glycerophosphodiester phosphodiesterase [Ramlibacter sp.]